MIVWLPKRRVAFGSNRFTKNKQTKQSNLQKGKQSGWTGFKFLISRHTEKKMLTIGNSPIRKQNNYCAIQ